MLIKSGIIITLVRGSDNLSIKSFRCQLGRGLKLETAKANQLYFPGSVF